MPPNGWRARGFKVAVLLLTHGHIDHVWDAARIQREHACRVGYHLDSEPMITERDFFKKFGFGWEIEPIRADWRIEECASASSSRISTCRSCSCRAIARAACAFSRRTERVLFGGDVLFAGGVGRWDLPGGDGELLFRGIREKVYPLGDDVTVLPGHGPATKIGIERQTNPYVREI